MENSIFGRIEGPRRKAILVSLAWTAYTLGFLVLYPMAGSVVAALAILPILLTCWSSGILGGVVAGLLAFPANMILMRLAGGASSEMMDAAGFLGSHLCDQLISLGHQVVGMDNFITGNIQNLAHLSGNPHFKFIRHDVANFIFVPGKLDAVLHFASPASPKPHPPTTTSVIHGGSLKKKKRIIRKTLVIIQVDKCL